MASATIKLFLPHGDAKRLRVCEVSNWTGKALAAPRTELDDLLAREEAENSGVYFLFGSDPELGDLLVYIGEAEVVRDRLKQRVFECVPLVSTQGSSVANGRGRLESGGVR